MLPFQQVIKDPALVRAHKQQAAAVTAAATEGGEGAAEQLQHEAEEDKLVAALCALLMAVDRSG